MRPGAWSATLLIAGLLASFPVGAQERPAGEQGSLAGARGADPSVVRGVVYDSTAAAPLEGAVVLLLGTAETATTGPDGTFRLTDVEPGMHRVTFFHPRLDELGLGSAAWEVGVEPGAEAEVELWIPSAPTIARVLCRSEPGILVGVLRDEEDGSAVEGSVTARWTDEGGERMRATATDEAGRFVLCGLPVDVSLRVRGVSEGSAGGVREVRMPRSGVVARDVSLDAAEGVAVAVGRPSAREPSTGEPAAVAGVVFEEDGGSPVVGAVVRLDGAPRSATSDARGRFAVPSVPPGRRAIEVEHLSFGVHRDTVHLEPGATLQMRIAVRERAFELAELEVTAQRRYSGHMAGFEDRMERGLGEFITREQIAQRESQPLERIIASRSTSLQLVCPNHPGRNPTGAIGGCWVESRRAFPSLMSFSNSCPMEYFVDGVFLSADFHIAQLDARDVEAIEIYPGPSSVPPRFNVTSSNCGYVVIWTRQPGNG